MERMSMACATTTTTTTTRAALCFTPCAPPPSTPLPPRALKSRISGNGSMKSFNPRNVSAMAHDHTTVLAAGLELGPRLVLNGYSSSFLGKGLSAEIPTAFYRRTSKRRAVGLARCEQASKEGNTASVWLGRLAMLGFVGVVGTEIITGKGVLEQVGIGSPAPTAALALTAVVGTIAAIGIFQSASRQ